MAIGIIGQKCGMTRIFTPEGKSIPVTVINILPNRVVAIKTLQRDGYRAIQVTYGSIKTSKVNKPCAGHYAKAEIEAGQGLCEFRLASDEFADIAVGSELTVNLFQAGNKVDITSKSKGKGFAGVIKRHNFRSQDASHGNSLSHRAPGSIGQCQDPGRVFKGKKMAGHMGNVLCTIQSQEIARVDEKRNLLLVKGGVPGAPGANVIVKFAVKQQGTSSGA